MNRIIAISILISTLILTQTCHSQITEHQFNFKGFAVTINDDAQDENGNHLLVGEIKVLEEQEVMRDTSINRIFKLKEVIGDDRYGIMLVTDSDYNVLKIGRSFIGKKVIYNLESDQFFIGANFFDYIEVKGKNFSAWQPVVIKTNLELKTEVYFLKKPYSCILQDMHLKKDRILLFTSSTNNEVLKERKEKIEVITVSMKKTRKSPSFSRAKNFKPLLTKETAFELGSTSISDVSKFNNSYYFTSSTLNQFTLTNTIHLYQFKDDKINEVEVFPSFLQFAMRADGWIILNNFYVDSMSNCFILSHKAATKKEITFVKTDTSFQKLMVKNIPLNDYAESNNMLVLKNGKIVLLSLNEEGNWSYYIYSQNMELLQEIKTSLYRKYKPMRLIEFEANQLTCLYSIDITSEHNCVVQKVDFQ
jgi:hypothetical protein